MSQGIKKVKEIVGEHNLGGSILPIKSVGVQGDSRTYSHPAVIVGDASRDVLGDISTKITNTVHRI